jgi:hypothetical protein
MDTDYDFKHVEQGLEATMTEFEDISRSLHPCLAFLTRWGYRPLPDEVCHSTLLGDQLLIRYVSNSFGRDVRIHFSSATATHASRFSVFVGSRDGQNLFVNDYLARRGRQNVSQSFINSVPEKTIAMFCGDVASILRLEFETKLADFVQGKAWNSPVFDWEHYK